jgi:hypothetical protein
VSDFHRFMDELNLDLQRVHEWTDANGLKLNSIRIHAIVISRCRVDISSPKVNNLGFVLNEYLPATDHFKKVCQKVYWILRSMRPHALHTSF